MAGAVSKKDILDIQGLDADRTNVIETLKAIAAAAVELSKTLGDTKGLKDLTASLKALNQVQAEFTKFQKQSIDMSMKAERLKQQEAKTQQQQNKAKEQSVKLTGEELQISKLQAIVNNSLAGSYDQLNAQYKLNIIELQKMSEEQRLNSARAKELTEQNTLLVGKLNALDLQNGKTKRSVNGLQWQVTQFAREIPSLAYGVNVFFGAISNNLPMLVDEIKAMRDANKIAAEAGKQTVPVWKQVGGAILNWQTALIIGLTALTLYGKEITTWISGLFKSKNAIDQLKISQERLTEANKKAYEDGQKDLVHVRLLYEATQNHAMSIEEKRKAINELRNQYPDYLGKFSEEEILAGKAGKAYYELANAIMASAKAKAYEQIIVENEVKKLELETKVLEERKKLIKAQISLDEARKQFGDVSGTEEAMAGASSMISAAQSNVDKYTQSIDDLNTQISQLEYSSKELAAKIKPSDLLKNFGQDTSKGKKGNEYTALEEMQNQHKKELNALNESQQLLLASTNQSEEQILQTKEDFAEELILKRLEQIEREKSIKELSNEQLAKLDVERSELEMKFATTTANFVISEQKRITKEIEDEKKKAEQKAKQERESASKQLLSDTENNIIIEQTALTKKAGEDIKAAKGNARKTKEIKDNLVQDMLNVELMYRKDVNQNDALIGEDKQRNSDRIVDVEKDNKERELKVTEDKEKQKQEIRQQIFEKSAELINAGFDIMQQGYANQLSRLEENHKVEIAAAGENTEKRILAERKYEEEKKKIARRQAIAEKAQAAFGIVLSTAQAIAAMAKLPFPANIALMALVGAIGAAQLAAVLAQKIPEYAKGTKNSEDTFIAGEKGAEIIATPSGDLMVTPDHATLYSDPKLKGSTVIPHDESSRILANLAMNNTRDIIDMRQTNKHLSNIEKAFKDKDSAPYVNAKGKLVVKKGSTTYIYN